jgi:radical SAM protein with 4Fe4S-binding SPASM domain
MMAMSCTAPKKKQTARVALAEPDTAPVYVCWEITHLCNARCLHCHSGAGENALTSGELSLKEGYQIISQLAEAGVRILSLSGGEPLLHPHWQQLVTCAIQRGLAVNIASNGSMLNANRVSLLKSLHVQSVTISLDSHLAEKHDQIRGRRGFFEYAVRAIRLLVAAGIRVVVSFTPTKHNFQDGLSVIALAYQLHVDAVYLAEYVPTGRGEFEYALTPTQLSWVLLQWVGARRTYQGRMDIIWHDCRTGVFSQNGDSPTGGGCRAGRRVARLLPEGSLTPCTYLSTVIGNLKTDSITDLWANDLLLQKLRTRSDHFTGRCGYCEHLPVCGGCRSVAAAYHQGNPLAYDPHCWIGSVNVGEMSELPAGEGLPL